MSFPTTLEQTARRDAAGGVVRFVTLLAFVALGLGCDAPDARVRPVLLTTADFAALVAAGAKPDEGLAPGYGLPGGMPLKRILSRQAGTLTLELRETLTEGYRSEYVTTEIWAGFPAVWVQPVYVPLIGHAADGTPLRAGPQDEHPIFGVGPRSAFYSPYWEVHTFEVPAGDTLASFKSVRDVLDRGVNLREGEARVMTIVPADVEPPTPTDVMDVANQFVVPKIGGPTKRTGLLDGNVVHFLDFNGGTFRWDTYGAIEEAPIFVWVARDATGALRALDLPTVAGTGPLYSNRPAQVWGANQDIPKYGSYWRLYTVEVPSTAQVFAALDDADTRRALDKFPSLTAATYDPLLKAADEKQYAGRVIIDPTCVANRNNADPSTPVDDPKASNCRYIDSQEKIEHLVPGSAIVRTDILVTCPFVSYHDVPVNP
ncbi:MAG: hypothetical protein JWM82_3818 [Myxococcales bacterium]|nr:hypothetical protein [Myxococcales bacterium]